MTISIHPGFRIVGTGPAAVRFSASSEPWLASTIESSWMTRLSPLFDGSRNRADILELIPRELGVSFERFLDMMLARGALEEHAKIFTPRGNVPVSVEEPGVATWFVDAPLEADREEIFALISGKRIENLSSAVNRGLKRPVLLMSLQGILRKEILRGNSTTECVKVMRLDHFTLDISVHSYVPRARRRFDTSESLARLIDPRIGAIATLDEGGVGQLPHPITSAVSYAVDETRHATTSLHFGMGGDIADSRRAAAVASLTASHAPEDDWLGEQLGRGVATHSLPEQAMLDALFDAVARYSSQVFPMRRLAVGQDEPTIDEVVGAPLPTFVAARGKSEFPVAAFRRQDALARAELMGDVLHRIGVASRSQIGTRSVVLGESLRRPTDATAGLKCVYAALKRIGWTVATELRPWYGLFIAKADVLERANTNA